MADAGAEEVAGVEGGDGFWFFHGEGLVYLLIYRKLVLSLFGGHVMVEYTTDKDKRWSD